jgi:hypothetical protein
MRVNGGMIFGKYLVLIVAGPETEVVVIYTGIQIPQSQQRHKAGNG